MVGCVFGWPSLWYMQWRWDISIKFYCYCYETSSECVYDHRAAGVNGRECYLRNTNSLHMVYFPRLSVVLGSAGNEFVCMICKISRNAIAIRFVITEPIKGLWMWVGSGIMEEGYGAAKHCRWEKWGCLFLLDTMIYVSKTPFIFASYKNVVMIIWWTSADPPNDLTGLIAGLYIIHQLMPSRCRICAYFKEFRSMIRGILARTLKSPE